MADKYNTIQYNKLETLQEKTAKKHLPGSSLWNSLSGKKTKGKRAWYSHY